MSDYQKQQSTPEIVDLIYKKKIYLDEEFSIFEPSESNVTIQRIRGKILKTINGSQETDADDLWEGSIFLKQTEFDFIDIEIHFAGSKNSYFNVPVTDGTMSFNSNNEKVFHYSFTSPADSIFMDIQIYEDFTKIQFPPGRININSKGYSSFDPNFTSILLKVPQLNIGFKDAKKKRPIRRSPEISPERMEQMQKKMNDQQRIMSERMNSDEGRRRRREMEETMRKHQVDGENRRRKWIEKKQESDEKCEIGFNLLAQGKTDKAIKSFNDAISIVSGNLQARHDLWDVFDNFKKDYQESEELFKDLIKSHRRSYHPTFQDKPFLLLNI